MGNVYSKRPLSSQCWFHMNTIYSLLVMKMEIQHIHTIDILADFDAESIGTATSGSFQKKSNFLVASGSLLRFS